MSKELDDAYFRSTPCTHHEPLLSKLVDCVNLLEERIKGLLGATVSVGETKTLPAGSEATAKAGKRGYDTVLDFGIPRGEKGDKGEPGAPGKDGAPGKSYTITESDYSAIAADVETMIQPKLDAKANLASPKFTGNPTVPYASSPLPDRLVNVKMLDESVNKLIKDLPVIGHIAFKYLEGLDFAQNNSEISYLIQRKITGDRELLYQIQDFAAGAISELLAFRLTFKSEFPWFSHDDNAVYDAKVYVENDPNAANIIDIGTPQLTIGYDAPTTDSGCYQCMVTVTVYCIDDVLNHLSFLRMALTVASW